jgi:hypothetical protein
VFLERYWRVGFNGIYLLIFGFRMWELLIFVAKNSNKFQKIRVWKEKSVKDVVTLECLPSDSNRKNCGVPLVLLKRPCNGI